MNEEAYRIRGFQPPDYIKEAKVLARLEPERLTSPEEIRRFDETAFQPPMVSFKIVAEDRLSGKAAGFGYLQSDVESYDPHTFWMGLAVDPDHQGRGLGLALLHALNLEAERREARRLWAGALVDDVRAVRFLARQGFVEQRRTWRSSLTLDRAANLPDRSESLIGEGVSFTTLADKDLNNPELLRDLYDLSIATSADEPRLGVYTPITFEQFVELELRGPSFLPDAYFLARAAGRFVASSGLRRVAEEPKTLHQSFTGTRREFRGRGIATELKRRTVEYARLHGYQTIRTGNDSLNQPMLAINRKLGFQLQRERIVAEKQLGS